MLIEPPKKSNKTFIVLLLLLAAGVACFVLFIGDLSLFSRGPSSFTIQNFWGKAQLAVSGKPWAAPERAKQLQLGDRLQTGPDGGLDIKFKGTRVRLKENTEIRIQAPKNGSDRIQLKKGTVLISSNSQIQLNVPGRFENAEFLSPMIVTASRGMFSASVPSEGRPWVQVLNGKVAAHTGMGKPLIVKELEKAQPESSTQLKVGPLSQTEWKTMSEVYELVSKSSTEEAAQMDLSKGAGNLFGSVFDHGTFYSPKSGFCERDFMQDAVNGEIYMEVRYDVYPREALVGVYLKMRNFDVSKYKTLKFDMRRVPEAGHPDKFLLEIKYRGQVIRRYSAKMLRTEWTTADFPLNFKKKTLIDEVTLTFANDQVGASKKGALHLKDFRVEEKTTEELAAEAAVEAEKAAVSSSPAAAAKNAPAAAPSAPPPVGMTEFKKIS